VLTSSVLDARDRISMRELGFPFRCFPQLFKPNGREDYGSGKALLSDS
jgi:hypothetical protein